MEFPFNVSPLFGADISLIDSNLLPYNTTEVRNALSRSVEVKRQLSAVLDVMGEASAKAQGLHGSITSSGKLAQSDHVVYVKVDRHTNNGRGAVLGFLKVGTKRLFMYDHHGHQHEMEPLCVLDFYVHESCQRKGLGKIIFDYMLQREDIHVHHLAIDRPSNKLVSFLLRHYGLKSTLPQVNNFVIFDGFFASPWNILSNNRATTSTTGVTRNSDTGSARYLRPKKIQLPSTNDLTQNSNTDYKFSSRRPDNASGPSVPGHRSATPTTTTINGSSAIGRRESSAMLGGSGVNTTELPVKPVNGSVTQCAAVKAPCVELLRITSSSHVMSTDVLRQPGSPPTRQRDVEKNYRPLSFMHQNVTRPVIGQQHPDRDVRRPITGQHKNVTQPVNERGSRLGSAVLGGSQSYGSLSTLATPPPSLHSSSYLSNITNGNTVNSSNTPNGCRGSTLPSNYSSTNHSSAANGKAGGTQSNGPVRSAPARSNTYPGSSTGQDPSVLPASSDPYPGLRTIPVQGQSASHTRSDFNPGTRSIKEQDAQSDTPELCTGSKSGHGQAQSGNLSLLAESLIQPPTKDVILSEVQRAKRINTAGRIFGITSNFNNNSTKMTPSSTKTAASCTTSTSCTTTTTSCATMTTNCTITGFSTSEPRANKLSRRTTTALW